MTDKPNLKTVNRKDLRLFTVPKYFNSFLYKFLVKYILQFKLIFTTNPDYKIVTTHLSTYVRHILLLYHFLIRAIKLYRIALDRVPMTTASKADRGHLHIGYIF